MEPASIAQLVRAYDSAVACANGADLAEGSTTTRVHDFVNIIEVLGSLGRITPILLYPTLAARLLVLSNQLCFLHERFSKSVQHL